MGSVSTCSGMYPRADPKFMLRAKFCISSDSGVGIFRPAGSEEFRGTRTEVRFIKRKKENTKRPAEDGFPGRVSHRGLVVRSNKVSSHSISFRANEQMRKHLM